MLANGRDFIHLFIFVCSGGRGGGGGNNVISAAAFNDLLQKNLRWKGEV